MVIRKDIPDLRACVFTPSTDPVFSKNRLSVLKIDICRKAFQDHGIDSNVFKGRVEIFPESKRRKTLIFDS
jgi:hypothetical protein